MSDIKKMMHLNYILPAEYEIKKNDISKEKILLIFHIYFEDLIDEVINYMKSMPESSDILITVQSEKLKKILELKVKKLENSNICIKKIENRGRDVSALLVGAKDIVMNYDYVCFMHDKKTAQLKPYCIGRDFRYKCYEGNLSSRMYVKNILNLFKENERLGMLMPPPPNHGDFYHTLGNEWASNFENTKKLLKELKLNVKINELNEPISPLGTMFWFRPQAMEKIFDYNWKYEDFPEEPNEDDGTILHAIERIYGYVVQDAGYYISWVMPEKLARIEMTNLYFAVSEINKTLFRKNYSTSLYGVVQLVGTIKSGIMYKIKYGLKKYLPNFILKPLKRAYRVMKSKS